MRLIDADELIEHAWRDKLDSRELIVQMIATAPTIKEIPAKIPIDVFEQLISQESVLDKIIAEIGQEIVPRNSDQYDYEAMWQNLGLRMALKIIGKHKAYKGTEHWMSAADHYICPVCGLIVVNPNHFIGRRCPQCGFQDKKDKEQEGVYV